MYIRVEPKPHVTFVSKTGSLYFTLSYGFHNLMFRIVPFSEFFQFVPLPLSSVPTSSSNKRQLVGAKN